MKWDNSKYRTSLVQIIKRVQNGENWTYKLYWEHTQKTETIKTYTVKGLKGYERISYPKRLQEVYIHRYLMKEHLERWADVFGCEPDDLIVHHIDEDRSNNVPDNLMVLTDMAHKNLHNAGLKDEERARKISEARMGMEFSDEHKQNISKALTGRKFTEEHRRNLALAHMKDKPDTVRVSPLDSLQSVACGRVFDTALFLILDLSKSYIIPRNKFGGLVWSKKKKFKKKDICDYLNIRPNELKKFLNGFELD